MSRYAVYLEFDADGEQDAEYAAGRARKALEEEHREATWGELREVAPEAENPHYEGREP